MADMNLLKTMLQDTIKGETESAKDNFHNWFSQKFQDVANNNKKNIAETEEND
jgi:hypothetical protein